MNSCFTEIENSGVEVKETPFNSERIKGLYVDDTIAINSRIKTTAEKACILAEEIGHYHTTYGNILDQAEVINRKQERRARGWAYERLIEPEKLIDAFRYSVKNRFELAEFLDVTEEFVENAIAYFKTKYWPYYIVGDYHIIFEPFGIVKSFERKLSNKGELL